MSQRKVPTGDDSRLPRSMRSPLAGLIRSDEDIVSIGGETSTVC